MGILSYLYPNLEIDQFRSDIIQRNSSNFTDRITLACRGINYLVGIDFWPPLTYSSINCEGFSSEVMAPRVSPVSTRAGSCLGWTNKMLSVLQYRALSYILSIYEYRWSRATAVTYTPITTFVWRNPGICSSAMKSHYAQTTSSLANIRFATSIPGLARNV